MTTTKQAEALAKLAGKVMCEPDVKEPWRVILEAIPLVQLLEVAKAAQLADELLDDIDTASDVFRPDNKSAYVQYVYKKCVQARELRRQSLTNLKNAGVEL